MSNFATYSNSALLLVHSPTSVNTDLEDIQQVLGGRVEFFNNLVRRYQGPLLRLAQTKLGDSILAEDAVQESFLAAFKSLHTYNPSYGFRTWLWTILLNQCRRHGHRQQRNRENEVLQGTSVFADRVPSRELGPPGHAMQREQAERLSSLLNRLPEVQADALRLRFFGGLKFNEIAEVMSCSLSSAKGRVKDGLRKISVWLADPIVESNSVSNAEQQ
jgi:RNA polymerase sigma-70 factor (ECF subfamily)